MTTPSAPNAISALDVKNEFGCATDFLSMQYAVFGNGNTPISMSTFRGQKAIPPDIRIGNTGFEYSGWYGDLNPASPYRRPSDNYLGILYDYSGGSPGLWARRNIGNLSGLSGDHHGIIKWTCSYWRHKCSKDLTVRIYTNGSLVYDKDHRTSEAVWQTFSISTGTVLINESTLIRVSAVNGTSWGEIGVKNSFFEFNNMEALLPSPFTMTNLGFEYAGWSDRQAGNSPYSGAMAVDSSSGGYTFDVRRTLNAPESFIGNMHITFDSARLSASGSISLSVITDGAVVGRSTLDSSKGSWITNRTAGIANVTINSSTILRLDMRNGDGYGSLGFRNVTIAFTPTASV